MECDRAPVIVCRVRAGRRKIRGHHGHRAARVNCMLELRPRELSDKKEGNVETHQRKDGSMWKVEGTWGVAAGSSPPLTHKVLTLRV